MEASVTQIVDNLIQKTREKKALWKESSTRGEYKILFEGATLTIGYYRDSYGKAFFILKILNDEGRVIVKESVFEYEPDAHLLRDLFLAAQETSLKKNDTLNSILAQLSQDSVGINDNSDLPF